MVVRGPSSEGAETGALVGPRSARPEISSRHRPRRATSDPGAETTTAPVPRSFLAYEPEARWDGRWKPAFRVVDFFCGCGGTSLGLVESGGRVILGIDNDPHASATFRRNFPTAAFIEGDIRAIPLEAILPRIQRTGKSPLLFCGCAPCQPFSRQNRQRGHQGDDPRTELLDIFCSFVRRYLPDLVLIENVAGIRDFGPRSPIDAAQAILRRHGYKTRLGSLDAQDYGVPQRRRRVFLIGSLSPVRPSFPAPTHGVGRRHPNFATVKDVIGHLPPLEAGEAHPSIPNHTAANLSPTNLARIRAIPVGGSRRDLPEALWLPCHSNEADPFTDVYGRLDEERPASAMTTRCVSLSNGRFGHPTQDRALSAREAACIQTFPDDFVFDGPLTAVARQVGNAVPVKLAAQIGGALVVHLTAAAASRA